jgi:hypothetical protein
VEVDRHFIKEKFESNMIQIPHVRSEEQLADILTKAVGSKEFTAALDKLGMLGGVLAHAPSCVAT